MDPLNPEDQESRSTEQRRLLFVSIFVLGTVLAAIGWIIEWKGLDEVSVKFARLTVLALVGHGLQVLSAFGLLVTPDEQENDDHGR